MPLDGVSIKLGNQEFIVPPLSLKSLRQLSDKLNSLQSLNGLPSNEQISVMVEVIHHAIRRNYPDLSQEALEDILDLGNIQMVFPAIMSASGLDQKKVIASQGQNQ